MQTELINILHYNDSGDYTSANLNLLSIITPFISINLSIRFKLKHFFILCLVGQIQFMVVSLYLDHPLEVCTILGGEPTAMITMPNGSGATMTMTMTMTKFYLTIKKYNNIAILYSIFQLTK